MESNTLLTGEQITYLKSYSVFAIIPAYNESVKIRDVIKSTANFVSKVIVIDDCSTDDTKFIAECAGAKVIRHLYNTGVGGSLRTGYKYCLNEKCDLVVQLDADGQHDPRHIPLMLNRLIDEKRDIVTGSRFLTGEGNEHHHFIRRAGIRFFSKLVRAIGGTKITDITSGFRAYRMNAIRALAEMDDKHWAVDQTLRALLLGFNYGELSVSMPKRIAGKSQFTMVTFVKYPMIMSKVILTAILFRRRQERKWVQ